MNAKEFLLTVRARPGMYASNKEAFCAIVLTALEMDEVDYKVTGISSGGSPAGQFYAKHIGHQGAAIVGSNDPFDRAWAHAVVDDALSFISAGTEKLALAQDSQADGARSQVLERLRVQFAEGLAVSVTESKGTLTLGFRSLSGREMSIYVQQTLGDHLLLSDGGETWSDFVSEGLTKASPVSEDEKRLVALAASYKVNWSTTQRAFVARCVESEALAVARRITMASIALDGWRVWLPEPDRATRAAQLPLGRRT